jgi:hypothetical protein
VTLEIHAEVGNGVPEKSLERLPRVGAR